MFSALDVCIFVAFLAVSLLVGLYHALASKLRVRRAPTHSQTAEFLTGGRRLPVIPVCLSLLTTFLSGLGLLSWPSEIYLRGFATALSFLSCGFAFVIISIFFIPVFYKLKFLNAYEYFELRFGSRTLRRVGTVLFVANTLIYIATVVYLPSIALAGVTDVPFWPFVIGVGAIGTIYTSVGGIKAVIWTDSLQAVFLYAGLGVLIVKGTIEAGGFTHLFVVSERTGRLSEAVFKFDPSLLQYQNFWLSQFGGIVHWICIYGLNQMSLQRYCSMASLEDAQRVMKISVPAIFLLSIMTCFIGPLLIAYFNGCDPLALGEVNTPDQLVILMASRVLGLIPGLPGLFLASLFSATLSTVSSGINSMSAVLYEDFVKPSQWLRNRDDRVGTAFTKVMTAGFGFLSCLMALSFHTVGGIYHITMTVMGAITGPLVGLFFLGIFFPSSNRNGAYAGLIVSTVFMVLCAMMNNLQKPYLYYVLTGFNDGVGYGMRSEGCLQYANDSIVTKRMETYFRVNNATLHYGSPETSPLARLSPFSYGIVGITITVVVGMVVSWLCPQKMSAIHKNNSLACTYSGLNIQLNDTTDGLDTIAEKSSGIIVGVREKNGVIYRNANSAENIDATAPERPSFDLLSS